MTQKIRLNERRDLALDEQDILEAMRDFGAYLDISPDDFRAIYTKAYAIAHTRFLEEICADQVMSSPVLSVAPSMSVRAAIDFLDAQNISGAPVLDGAGQLLGVLSETDIARLAGGSRRPSPMHLLRSVLSQTFDPACLEVAVETIMTREVICVSPQTSLAEMLSLVNSHDINRLPVTEAGKRVVGLVSRTDLLNVLSTLR